MLGDSPVRHAIVAALVALIAARLVLGAFTLWGLLAPVVVGLAVFLQARWAVNNRS